MSHIVQANGVKVHYRVDGQGDPLVLLHAGTLSGDMWQPYLAAFTEHYRVITPDMRGHGRSDNPKGAMTYGQLADDIVAFIRALDLRDPLIAGFSDGGQVAQNIERAHVGVRLGPGRDGDRGHSAHYIPEFFYLNLTLLLRPAYGAGEGFCYNDRTS